MSVIATQPYNRSIVLTKSDTLNIDGTTAATLLGTINKPQPCDAVYVGGTGIVNAVFEDGSIVPFTAAVGEILPIKIIRVTSSTTTATLMNALYYV
jgi:hypothetical protein